MIVYICEQGAKICRKEERLIVCVADKTRTLYTHQLRQLLLFGNVHLTAQARSLLLAKKIDTVFLSSSGSYRGRLVTVEGENIFLRKRQYLLLDDPQFQLKIARKIVRAKLHNQTAMLSRIKREHNLPEAASGIMELKSLAKEAETAENLNNLRGIEGAGAAAYFHWFAKAFHTDWGFHGRFRRPPPDPVNAILSLIYTLLVDRCHTACRLAGLDPFPANLHSPEYGRQSLPLDLVEEFRAIPGDALTLSLFNKHILKADDFEEDEEMQTQRREASPRLKSESLKKVLAAFSKKMAAGFYQEHDSGLTYEKAINHQAMAYRKLVEGKVNSYIPILWH